MYYNSFGGGAVYRLSAAPSLRRQNKTVKAPGIISQGLIFASFHYGTIKVCTYSVLFQIYIQLRQ